MFQSLAVSSKITPAFTILVFLVSVIPQVTRVCVAQDNGTSPAPVPATAPTDMEPVYPLAVAVDVATDGENKNVFCVDLDLPGVWAAVKQPDASKRDLFVRGSGLLRKPLNRPRCVIVHPGGGILVGDSATREVYHVKEKDAEPIGLTNGYIGIPMALAIDPEGKMLYVGDAEKRATFRLPIEGGKPELVARVNARGLAFDADGNLWAVTPDAVAIVRIDVENGTVEDIVTERPFQYPNGLCWAGDHGYVTDGYGKCIWKFTPDGKTEKWFEGDPLVGPVGIAVTETSLYVADPKQKQVYQFDRETKEFQTRL